MKKIQVIKILVSISKKKFFCKVSRTEIEFSKGLTYRNVNINKGVQCTEKIKLEV